MQQVSIRDQIKKLVELQTVDFEIYNFKRELEEKPLVLDSLKAGYEAKQQGLKALEEESKKIFLDRKAKELELQVKEGDIVKTNSQLSLIKTNKEYQAKLTEIESLKADKSVIEEKVIILYDEGDSVNANIKKEKEILADEEKKYLSQKKEIEDSIKLIEDKLKVLEGKRKQITPEIDKNNLSRYERILPAKQGMAIVPVKTDSCGGCYMNVPPQVINEIKMHERLIFCEMCTRILYLPEDL